MTDCNKQQQFEKLGRFSGRRAGAAREHTMSKRFSGFLFFAVSALLLAAAAFAGVVDGAWAGTLTTPRADYRQAFTFKAEGAKLTGTVTLEDQAAVAITDGKIDGKHISFAVNVAVDGKPTALGYTGEIGDGQIALTVEVKETGRTFDMVAKKAH
jgi:hypothetical protein